MSEPTFNLDFKSIIGEKEVDQARALRMVLAVVQDDLVQLVAVAEEVYRDKRGHELATWELVMGIAGALAHEWVSSTGKETAIKGIQIALMGNAEQGASNV